MPLADEQKRQYAESGGVRCPYCGSDYLEAGLYDAGEGYFKQNVTCTGCGKRWDEVFHMDYIEEVNDG